VIASDELLVLLLGMWYCRHERLTRPLADMERMARARLTHCRIPKRCLSLVWPDASLCQETMRRPHIATGHRCRAVSRSSSHCHATYEGRCRPGSDCALELFLEAHSYSRHNDALYSELALPPLNACIVLRRRAPAA